MFQQSFHEKTSPLLAKVFRKKPTSELKAELWNEFVDSHLLGICDDDCSVVPRILPLSYLPTIVKTCQGITTFLMKLLSLPTKELNSIILHTPITDYLIQELEVLKHRPKRLTGSLRFDMAISGLPDPNNPPKLLEVNEIGFDGTGRSSLIQEKILQIMPELRTKVKCLDTAKSEVQNMRRLGRNMVRFQYDVYNWEEEVILAKAKQAGLNLRLVSPKVFKIKPDKDFQKMVYKQVKFKNGKIYLDGEAKSPDVFQVSYSFELADYKEAPDFFRNLIISKIPQYSPFVTGLVAPKTVLPLLADKALRKRLIPEYAKQIENAVLPTQLLSEYQTLAKKHFHDLVLKHGDGMGGERVYVGQQMLKKIAKIPKNKQGEWALQQRLRLNTIDVHGILSRPRKVIADLGVYIHYDWDGKKFTNFRVGGFITRATNRSLKVNVSGGGIQVPVMFDKSR